MRYLKNLLICIIIAVPIFFLNGCFPNSDSVSPSETINDTTGNNPPASNDTTVITPGSSDTTVVDSPPAVEVDNEYQGMLTLNFTNTFPSFDVTVSVSVTLNKDGSMTFGSGTGTYEGDDNNGQLRIKRSGTLTLQPTGNSFNNNGAVYLAVNENTTYNENMKTWVWTGSTWMQTMDENPSGLWDGGLSFSLNDAVISGSTVEASNGQGAVRWTLTLTPSLN